jgi:hypothetical protein
MFRFLILEHIILHIRTIAQAIEALSVVDERIALCIFSKARAFWRQEVYRSLLQNIWNVEKLGIPIDVYLSLAQDDALEVDQHRHVVSAFLPKSIRFDSQEACNGSDMPFCIRWIDRSACAEMIRSYESEFGLSYTWISMVRTDSRWDADFPDVRNLDRNYVHARLRCPGQLSVTSRHLQLGSFVRPTQLTMYMPDILNQTCIPISRSDKLTKFGCACQPWGCQISEQVSTIWLL